MREHIIALENVIDLLDSYDEELPTDIREKTVDELGFIASALRDIYDEQELNLDSQDD